MRNWLIFLGMGLVTFLTRYTMIALLGRDLPPLLQRWLRYVPAAVLAALVAPAALAPHGRVQLGAEAWAVAAGALVAWRTRSVLWTIVGGLAAFWLLRILGVTVGV
ncbi:MAG: AzlD domain-containing protein [Chloroflexi bacterium]|nr:AzlD domain-containing protein [Chloroflexota bacterium]